MKKVIITLMLFIIIVTVFSCGETDEPVEPSSIIKISASSTLEENTKKYDVSFLFDRDEKSSWVEGRQDDGTGESVIIELSKKTKIKTISFSNGYWEPVYYLKNNRVKEIKMTADSGDSFLAELEDTAKKQAVDLPKEWDTKTVKFEIVSVYPGPQWRDTAITEIMTENVEKLTAAKPVASRKIEFPLGVSRDGYNFTLYDNGMVLATGTGAAQCDMPFVFGTWKKSSDNKIIITYTVNRDKGCGFPEASNNPPEWVEMETIVE